ncbi:acrylyl-CoA reductase (NADPH) [Diaminobutyricimonas aerilata]|uniref:Acrylyl-CoA reductase (NADPH) n=1 Tax=Diaminobutyricimonas aerilata TaxID=1162967 RepID=A0A2M9CF34_9MICO|nr:MDR family oxidoreductase [Diaminobutyricimonas aerilata]PJJ70566.1 acrylyl-CoA reductase (NADPH) [Diaminobutyricimonas aerilata]
MRAWTVTRNDDGETTTRFVDDHPEPDATAGEVTVDIEYSSLNFKDAMALRGDRGVARTSPLVPGIDLVGRVTESGHADFERGDRVVLNGWGIGETRDGGYTERARVPGDWLVPLPEAIDNRRAAAIGTAGFTAMLAVMAVENHPDGPVLVTGASGGVGSIATALLARLGHEVVAATGHPDDAEGLHRLGATRILDRAELAEPGKPLQSQRWAAAVDSAGGAPLANVLAQTRYGGVVAACGLVAGAELPTTVMPFILRAVTLVGINSVECPREQRLEAWRRLATDLDLDLLDSITASVPLADVQQAADRILRGEVDGRVVVEISG